MATSNNTIKTRVQLKNDTEENWNKAGPKNGSPGFIPLRGELIVYSADNAHHYSRLKIGDGINNVVNLPFIDAGTINGEEEFIVKYANFNSFPSPGNPSLLYVDLSTGKIYHYPASNSYSELAHFNLSVTKRAITEIVSWSAGSPTRLYVQGNTLIVEDGVAPNLRYQDINVVTDVKEGGA